MRAVEIIGTEDCQDIHVLYKYVLYISEWKSLTTTVHGSPMKQAKSVAL